MTSFVGRRRELAEVKRLLSESRLVTLTGVGGVGKTRLALRVAVQRRRAFPHGVWLVSLADLAVPRLLLPTVATVLGVQDYSAQPLMATLTEFLRGRHLLLVLDNCEHLLDACAGFIEAVLPAAPKVRVLATSRQSLGMTAERSWRVPPLLTPGLPGGAPDEVRISARVLAGSEAVTLFVERARAVRPDFGVTPANGAAVARICQRLDGIPLALELAAARLRVMSEAQILQRLDDRFRLLTLGNRGAVSRQQTLQALIDWSYEHCTASERALWERAAVFSGGFELAAAEQVCAGESIASEDVLDLVDALVDKSILSVDRDGPARYRMLETIRQYAQDRLAASGQQILLRRRHRDHYQQFAQTAHNQWFGPDQVAWLARLRREHANLRAALEFCLTEPGQAQHALTTATAIWFYFVSGHVSEGRRWYERALALATEPAPPRAAALWANGLLAVQQGDFPAARLMLQESRALAEALGDRSNLAAADTWSGWIATNEGDLHSAVTHLEQALAEHLTLGDVLLAVMDRVLLAIVALQSGDVVRAMTLIEQCRTASEARGELWLWSWAHFLSCVAAWRLGDHQRARASATEGMRIKVQLDDRLAIGYFLELLAWLTAADDPERAARLLGAAHGVLQAIGGTLPPYISADHDRCTVRVRATLGETTFIALFDRGAALTLDEALADALQDKAARPETAAAAQLLTAGQQKPSPLTRREHEVAVLVAEALTNKQIAGRLVISQRTVESHVEHIMTKLGFTSRTQIATMIIRGPHAM